MRALEDELADPAAWATQYEAAKSEARHTAARRAVEDAYAALRRSSTEASRSPGPIRRATGWPRLPSWTR